jgi:hypothetical protein
MFGGSMSCKRFTISLRGRRIEHVQRHALDESARRVAAVGLSVTWSVRGGIPTGAEGSFVQLGIPDWSRTVSGVQLVSTPAEFVLPAERLDLCGAQTPDFIKRWREVRVG